MGWLRDEFERAHMRSPALTMADLYDAFDKLMDPTPPDPVCQCGSWSAITRNREWLCGNGHKLHFDDNGKLIRKVEQ